MEIWIWSILYIRLDVRNKNDKKKLEEAIGGDMTQSELLTELVRLTQLNNNLLKKGNKITAEIEV